MPVNNELAIAQSNYVSSGRALVKFLDLAFSVVGGPSFFESLESDDEFQILKLCVDARGLLGSLISESEASSLAALRPPSDLKYRENLEAFVARWNRSQEYYAQGSLTPSDLPSTL